MAKDQTDAANEVAQRTLFSDDELAELHSTSDVNELLANAGIVPESFDDYGSGFSVLEDKRQLIKVPFYILEWRVNAGDMGEFTSLVAMTERGDKYVVNDGSTGIHEQLAAVVKRREAKGITGPALRAGLVVRKGLRVSDYEVEIDGKMSKASTFYLAN